MKETERKKINENLKSIINEAVNVLPTGEMLALINLSARAELHFKKNNKSNSEAIIDINNMIKEYSQFFNKNNFNNILKN